MKGLESGQEQTPPPPRVIVVDGGGDRHQERVFDSIPDGVTVTFEQAYRQIVGNIELEKLVIRGLTSNDVFPYATLINTITKYCVGLSDSEIDNIIGSFKRELSKHADKHQEKLTGAQLKNLQTGQWNDRRPQDALNPGGIKAVAHFIHARMLLHTSTPKTYPAFYFENYLDAHHKIDLIEVIEGDQGKIINLIQVKSYQYPEGEIQKNTQAHKDWVNDFTVDVGAYEQMFSSEPKNNEQYRNFLKKMAVIDDILLELFTEPDPSSININTLYAMLGISNFAKAEQIWILEQYIPTIREAMGSSDMEGLFQQLEIEQINAMLALLEKQVEKAKQHYKGLEGVSEVHSICTVDKQIVSDQVIFKTDDPKQMKAIKIQK